MNKIGILTGVLIIVFAIMEKMTIGFYIGFGLLVLSLIAELYKGRIRNILHTFSLYWRMFGMMRYRKRHIAQFQNAEEWIQRLVARYPYFVQSSYIVGLNGRLNVKPILHEKADGESVLSDFFLMLQHKGIRISEEWIRLEINRHVLHKRLELFDKILCSTDEQSTGIPELLHKYVEEGHQVEGIQNYRSFWNCMTLRYYIELNYSLEERNRIFPNSRKMEIRLSKMLDVLENEYRLQQRSQQLEEWLLDEKLFELLSIQQFDQTIHSFTEFRKGIVYILEKLGYRVTLPNEDKKAVHLLIERSGLTHGVVLRPLAEGECITIGLIHEIHTLRTILDLQSVWIITNRAFTLDAKTVATRLGIVCIDRERLSEWINHFSNPFAQSS